MISFPYLNKTIYLVHYFYFLVLFSNSSGRLYLLLLATHEQKNLGESNGTSRDQMYGLYLKFLLCK